MAMMIRKQHGLTALSVGYSQDPHPTTRSRTGRAQLTCLLESAEDAEERWEIPATAIGLVAGREDAEATIVDDLGPCRDRLLDTPAVGRLTALREPLWLIITSEHPVLPAIDWETGLAPLGLPVLRVPSRLGTPTAVPQRPRVVLLVTMPVAKAEFDAIDIVGGVLEGILGPDRAPEVHVFADADLVPDLRHYAGPSVVVHDPSLEGAAEQPGEPWTDWIERSMKYLPVDVLHVVGHGFLSSGEGGFAAAESPLHDFDRSSARFVWPPQLASLMTSIGAWAFVVTAVPGNYSAPALRLLTGRVAALRSAAGAFHDVDRRGPYNGPDAIYRLLLRHPADPPPDPRGLSLVMHPQRFGLAPVDGPEAYHRPSYLDDLVDSYLDDLVDTGPEAKPWMVGARRQIAQWETQLSVRSGVVGNDAARAGLELTRLRLDAALREGPTT